MNLPDWVTNAVGTYALLGSVCFVVLLVVAIYAIVLMAQLSTQVKLLTGKVQALTDRVSGIAEQVSHVTTEVGARTTGIVRMVDESAGGAIRVLELLAPVLVIVGAFMRIRRYGRSRR